jgi:hypothetical protein
MPCSEKKRQANRQNAQKSTSPKSLDGKAKVGPATASRSPGRGSCIKKQ